MSERIVLNTQPLGFVWGTDDPFLFCVHHADAYPAGNAELGPDASLEGRSLGQDFQLKDGWRMYHGEVVPGFPQHPHRGFETVTIARKGLIDHSDSLGAAARFGGGDVQWMTAGRGIVHSEMFPLLERSAPNPAELFQIWLNLPKRNKLVDPHFAMFWHEQIPTRVFRDAAGRGVEVTVIAGRLGDAAPPSPPPKSWASEADADVAIWTIALEPSAEWTLPAARPGTKRTLYLHAGGAVRIDGETYSPNVGISIRPDVEVPITAVDGGAGLKSELLLLQGRPIGEPVAQHGPFVMNTRAEIQQAFLDYQRTQFGGWPWPSDAPVHPREESRFARHADGKLERPA